MVLGFWLRGLQLMGRMMKEFRLIYLGYLKGGTLLLGVVWIILVRMSLVIVGLFGLMILLL